VLRRGERERWEKISGTEGEKVVVVVGEERERGIIERERHAARQDAIAHLYAGQQD
jgi:hypothetical protein